jgi:hypothetical protein
MPSVRRAVSIRPTSDARMIGVDGRPVITRYRCCVLSRCTITTQPAQGARAYRSLAYTSMQTSLRCWFVESAASRQVPRRCEHNFRCETIGQRVDRSLETWVNEPRQTEKSMPMRCHVKYAMASWCVLMITRTGDSSARDLQSGGQFDPQAEDLSTTALDLPETRYHLNN